VTLSGHTAAEARIVVQVRRHRARALKQVTARLNATFAGRRVLHSYLDIYHYDDTVLPNLDVLRSFLREDDRATAVLAVAESTGVSPQALRAFIDRVYELD